MAAGQVRRASRHCGPRSSPRPAPRHGSSTSPPPRPVRPARPRRVSARFCRGVAGLSGRAAALGQLRCARRHGRVSGPDALHARGVARRRLAPVAGIRQSWRVPRPHADSGARVGHQRRHGLAQCRDACRSVQPQCHDPNLSVATGVVTAGGRSKRLRPCWLSWPGPGLSNVEVVVTTTASHLWSPRTLDDPPTPLDGARCSSVPWASPSVWRR